MARLDIDLFAASLRYARDASGGLFDPRKLSRYHDVDPASVAADEAARVLAWTPYPVDYLKGLHPTHPAYGAMKSALAELRARHAPGAVSLIPDGGLVRAGGSDPRIPAVRQKLIERGYADAALAPGADPLLFDKELSAQLRLFQKASRIKVTGVLGPQTVAALNADLTERRRRSSSTTWSAALAAARSRHAPHLRQPARLRRRSDGERARGLVDARHRGQAQHPDQCVPRRDGTRRLQSVLGRSAVDHRQGISAQAPPRPRLSRPAGLQGGEPEGQGRSLALDQGRATAPRCPMASSSRRVPRMRWAK
jgi:hypothetical protein